MLLLVVPCELLPPDPIEICDTLDFEPLQFVICPLKYRCTQYILNKLKQSNVTYEF